MGPVDRSQAGNKFILVISDYATRYPEAFPVREVTAKNVASGSQLHESHALIGLSTVRN